MDFRQIYFAVFSDTQESGEHHCQGMEIIYGVTLRLTILAKSSEELLQDGILST